MRYPEAANGILVLGESTYGSDPPLAGYVPVWIRSGVRDTTFSRIFNAFSGFHTDRATVTEREKFWAQIAFYNFVTRSIGPTREDRPTDDDYLAAQMPLKQVLEEHRPRAVMILGAEQAKYSAPIVASSGIPSVVTPHPTSYGLRTQVLKDAWHELQAKRNG